MAKKGSRKCLHFWEEEQQAKRACFEYFQSSRKSVRCDDVTERGKESMAKGTAFYGVITLKVTPLRRYAPGPKVEHY